MWDSTGRITTTYDKISRVTEVKNPADKVITYTYYDDNTRKETVGREKTVSGTDSPD